jgi:hypothetical protein
MKILSASPFPRLLRGAARLAAILAVIGAGSVRAATPDLRILADVEVDPMPGDPR